MATFKEVSQESNVDKVVKKAGLSLAIIFSKEEIVKYNIKYGSIIRLNNAEVIVPEISKDI